MSHPEIFIVPGARCSQRQCPGMIEPGGGRAATAREAQRRIDALASGAGWSKYVGKAVRFYCPAHPPTAGTLSGGRLRKVFGP